MNDWRVRVDDVVMSKIPFHDPFLLMQTYLQRVLSVMVVYTRTAKNQGAKEQAGRLVIEIREALQAAEEAE